MMNEIPVVVRAQDLGDVMIKLSGLKFLFVGAMAMPSPFTVASIPGSSIRAVLGSATYGIVYLVLGVCLTRWSAWLSRKLFGSKDTAEVPFSIVKELQILVFRVAGIFALVNGLPSLVQALIESMSEDLQSGAFSMVGLFGTNVALGVVLLLDRSAWILRVWRKLRPRHQA
jgi:hypothetical protein